MKKIIWLVVLLSAFALSGVSQPRPVEKDNSPAPKGPAPSSVKAKYEGGLYGYSKKEEGNLKFDDENERLVFYGKDGKERFGVPYKSIMLVYPNSQSAPSVTGTAVSVIPVPGAGIAGMFIKKKNRYLILHFDDPDVDARGQIGFKLDTLDLVESVVHSIGEKSKLTQRGDSYYRPRVQKTII
jgi:hypothetical protein